MSARIPLLIDGGSTTGYAYALPGAPKPKCGTVEMPSTQNIGRFCNAMADWLMPFCQEAGITEVHVEAPIISDHGGSGVNIHEVDKLFGIVHAVEMCADRMEFPTVERLARNTIVKHVAGTGRGTRKLFKTMCLLAVQRKGFNTMSEDIADAIAALDYFTWREKIPVGWNNEPAAFPLFEGNGVRIEPSNERAAKKLINSALSFDRDKGAA